MNTCVIEIDSKEYTLCLTRQAVKEVESIIGLNLQTFADKPMTAMDALWFGSFLTNHKPMTESKAIKLMSLYQQEGGDVNEVIEFLSGEYANFINAQTDTKAKKKAKIVRA